MKIENENASSVEIVQHGEFVDVVVRDYFDTESYCTLNVEQVKELVDYLLGLLGETRTK